MLLRQGIGSTPYSLFSSVAELWHEGFIVLMLFVVGFSILFPFAKLGLLGWITLTPKPSPRQKKILHWVEVLGKWSMFDVFLVSIILALTSSQILVGSKPLVGLTVFIVAILLSMIAGEMLSRHLRQPTPAVNTPAEGHGGGWLALSGIALVATLAFPFLKIDDWLLSNREYSIASLSIALWHKGAWLAALLVACFLILAPLISWTASLASWLINRRGTHSARAKDAMQLAQRWNMLDVFGLALAIFVLESDQLMSVEMRWGALFLGTMLAMQIAFNAAFNQSLDADRKESH